MICSKYPNPHFKSGILLFWLEMVWLRCSTAKPQPLMQVYLWKKNHSTGLQQKKKKKANTHNPPSKMKPKPHLNNNNKI